MTDGVRVLACLVLILATAALAWNMMLQCRKPTGWLGRCIVRIMNRSHADLISWGLGHIQVNRGDAVLDVGCGGGLNVQRLARWLISARCMEWTTRQPQCPPPKH